MKHFFALSVLLALAACSSERESAGRRQEEVIPAAVKGETSKTEKVGDTGRNHAYIRRFYLSKGRFYATVDYIQFLTGKAAVAAARRKGDAQAEVVNGDTIYSVFDDHYIINDIAKPRTFPLSEQASITLWDTSGDLRQYSVTPAQMLDKGKALLRYAPFVVETTQGRITSITQQYVP